MENPEADKNSPGNAACFHLNHFPFHDWHFCQFEKRTCQPQILAGHQFWLNNDALELVSVSNESSQNFALRAICSMYFLFYIFLFEILIFFLKISKFEK